jgi:hypothetical protein
MLGTSCLCHHGRAAMALSPAWLLQPFYLLLGARTKTIWPVTAAHTCNPSY